MKTAILCAPGLEECEALVTRDLLVRAKIDVTLIGLENRITSSRNVTFDIDTTIEKEVNNLYDCLILPGGIPGTPNLEANEYVSKMIDNHINNNKYIAAICAAPSILIKKGLLNSNEFTCAPGHECGLTSTKEKAHIHNMIITGNGLGGVFEFASLIIEVLDSKETAENVLKKICYR